jgi:hypothetical protein
VNSLTYTAGISSREFSNHLRSTATENLLS